MTIARTLSVWKSIISVTDLQIDHITAHWETAARSLLVSLDDTLTISVGGVVGPCCEALIAFRYLVIGRKAGLGCVAPGE